MQRPILDIPVIVTVSDDYLPILKVFCFLFNKNWSDQQPVQIFGFREPDFSLPANFTFISLGKQQGPLHFCQDLYNILEQVNSDIFIHMVENEFLLKPIRLEILQDLIEDAKTYDKVGRIDLTLGPSLRDHEVLEKRDNYSLIQLSQSATYRISLRLSIWKISWMKKYLFQGLNPWEFEIIGSQAATGDGFRVMATKEKLVAHHMDGVIIQRGNDIMDLRALKKDSRSSYNEGVREEDIKEMIDLGYIEEIREGQWAGLFRVRP